MRFFDPLNRINLLVVLWDQFDILLAQILTIFDLLNPNFDKNLENVWILGLKKKLP